MTTFSYGVLAPHCTYPYSTQLPAIFQKPEEMAEGAVKAIEKPNWSKNYPGSEVSKIFKKYGARFDSEYGVDEIIVEAQDKKEADNKISGMFNDFKGLIKTLQGRDINFKISEDGGLVEICN
jgi:hypothetical protein